MEEKRRKEIERNPAQTLNRHAYIYSVLSLFLRTDNTQHSDTIK